jgi:hypothetical protein
MKIQKEITLDCSIAYYSENPGACDVMGCRHAYIEDFEEVDRGARLKLSCTLFHNEKGKWQSIGWWTSGRENKIQRCQECIDKFGLGGAGK